MILKKKKSQTIPEENSRIKSSLKSIMSKRPKEDKKKAEIENNVSLLRVLSSTGLTSKRKKQSPVTFHSGFWGLN